MDAWWTRLGLEISGKDDLQIGAREHVLEQVLPTLFDGPNGLVSGPWLEEVVAAADVAADHIREAKARRAAGWTTVRAGDEVLVADDAVPDDQWERITSGLGALDASEGGQSEEGQGDS